MGKLPKTRKGLVLWLRKARQIEGSGLGNRGIICKGLLARKLRFTIRLRGDRDLIPIDKGRREGRKRSSLTLAKSCRCRRKVKLNLCKEGEVPRTKDLYLETRRIKLPFLHPIPALLQVTTRKKQILQQVPFDTSHFLS